MAFELERQNMAFEKFSNAKKWRSRKKMALERHSRTPIMALSTSLMAFTKPNNGVERQKKWRYKENNGVATPKNGVALPKNGVATMALQRHFLALERHFLALQHHFFG